MTENDFAKVSCCPKKGTVDCTIGERAMGRMFDATLTKPPSSDAEEDFVGDVFMSLVKSAPQTKDAVPPDRAANKSLMDWTLGNASFQDARRGTIGDPVVSSVTAPFMHAYLTENPEVQDAMQKQANAESSKKHSEEETQAAIDTATSDPEASAEHMQNADKARKQAEWWAEQATKQLDELAQSTMGKALMASIAYQVGEKAGETRDVMASWGLGPGSLGPSDVELVKKFVSGKNERLAKIAKMVGRFRGISRKAAEGTRMGRTGPVTRPDYTRDFTRIMPTQRAYLSPNAPEVMKRLKIAEYVGHGLMGWTPTEAGRRNGAFVCMIDGSGSMTSGDADALAVGMGIGIAKTAKDDDNRRYVIEIFGTKKDRVPDPVTEKSPWSEHVALAERMPHGGTDFDHAFDRALIHLKKLKDAGVKGADLVFITDGMCNLTLRAAKTWKQFHDEDGSRLFSIIIGSYSPGGLEDISDVVIKLPDHKDLAGMADDIVFQISSKMAEDITE